ASGEPPPAHVELARRLGLSDFERDVLLLTAAAELDPNVAALCARVQPAYTRGHPTFGLAMRLFDNPAWEALGPHGSLRRLHLLSVDTEPGVVNGGLRADERVVNFVKGLDHLDERLAVLLAPMATGEGDVGTTPSQAPVVDAIRRRIDATPGGPVLVNLIGPDTVSKRLIAERAATDAGRYPLRVPITNLPPVGRDLDLLIRLWERDALLSPVALYLDASDEVSSAEGEGAGHSRQAVDRLLGRARGLVFLDSREAWANLEAGALVLDVPGPSGAEQRAAWASVLGQGQQATAADLAAQFDLDLLAIRSASAAGIEDDGPDAVRKAALQLTRPRLDLLAQRVEPKAKSNDLVVTDEVADQLARIKQQVLHRATVHGDWGLEERTSRGLGITALFAGESGTGKTLAAEVLAGDLGLNLYRIDLSAVVSKYIGETEKNLRRLFDAAERGGTILFFDEADALFGKRSEVRDSHDRYANIEVNYLLQRMEGYRGLAILATNMKSALDRAFARRLRFVVDFPFPGLPERERIWRRSFVERVDAAGLDYASLAKLVLTGGSIHNVAVNATFAAAAAPGQALTMPMVLAAARMEYRKLGLPVNEADFRWQEAPARELAGAAAQVGPS
ncbi:MAG: hypothetical protein QOK43_528, partial [Acidimicrobiaceae bacterium]|nr:hypothetical protein [Acidimicrobiaceae bacterium]